MRFVLPIWNFVLLASYFIIILEPYKQLYNIIRIKYVKNQSLSDGGAITLSPSLVSTTEDPTIGPTI